MENNIHTLKKTARISGLLYLFLIITGLYCVMYVPSQIYVKGDIVNTARNIISHEFLYRTGIISDIISNIIFVFLVMVLYKLFNTVNENHARLMVVLVLVQVPAVFFMETFNIASLMILKGDILNSFDLSQRQDMAIFFFNLNNYGTLTLEMFWGIWLIPFGLLVYKSGFIPRIFGILIFMAAIAYIIGSIVSLLFPAGSAFVNLPILLLVAIGEISITLWFLIKGVKNNIPIKEKI